jgi:hypothetical protein
VSSSAKWRRSRAPGRTAATRLLMVNAGCGAGCGGGGVLAACSDGGGGPTLMGSSEVRRGGGAVVAVPEARCGGCGGGEAIMAHAVYFLFRKKRSERVDTASVARDEKLRERLFSAACAGAPTSLAHAQFARTLITHAYP